MMRRVTVTIPDDLEADLERFLASQTLRPSIGSVMRAALQRFIAHAEASSGPPLLQRVLANRETIREMAARRRVGSIRLFGSVARGEDTRGSDIDFLVTPDAGCTLFDIASLRFEIAELLDVETDVVSDRTVPRDQHDALILESVAL